MKIAGFVCNYPCSISCDRGERSGIAHLVKEIDFWDGELVQSIRLDADSSKGSSEEVSKALDVSLKTWSIPRCPLRSHYLVCIKNRLFIVGIGLILNKVLILGFQRPLNRH